MAVPRVFCRLLVTLGGAGAGWASAAAGRALEAPRFLLPIWEEVEALDAVRVCADAAVDVFAAVNDDARHRSAARLVAKTLVRVHATRAPSALGEFVFEIGAGPAEDVTEDRMEELTRMWAPLDEELIHLAERCDLPSVRFASTNVGQASFDVLARMFPQVHARKLLSLETVEENSEY